MTDYHLREDAVGVSSHGRPSGEELRQVLEETVPRDDTPKIKVRVLDVTPPNARESSRARMAGPQIPEGSKA